MVARRPRWACALRPMPRRRCAGFRTPKVPAARRAGCCRRRATMRTREAGLRAARACSSPTTTPTCATTCAACCWPRAMRSRWRRTGEAALEAALGHPPDLVLSDIMMPRLDGLGLLAAVRADPALHQIPVLLALGARGRGSARRGPGCRCRRLPDETLLRAGAGGAHRQQSEARTPAAGDGAEASGGGPLPRDPEQGGRRRRGRARSRRGRCRSSPTRPPS